MTDATIPDVLQRSLIFSSLGRDELADLSRLASERNFQAGEFTFWEGDAANLFYVVAVGRIKAVKHSSTGKEFIIAFFGPGEMFGEVAVFEDRPYPASAQAVVDSRVLGIRKDDFLAFLASHPKVALVIINVLSGRLREAQGRLKDMSGERVEQRLARTLYRLFYKLGPDLPFTRQEIADLTGITTETAIRAMAHLKERGIIRATRGKVIILDGTKLKLLGEGPPVLR